MKYLFIFTNFIIGSCLASHAAVVYEHWNDKNFIYSRSQCNNCHLELSILDEIPLLSYLFLQGKCRYCYQQIPVELFLFELIIACYFTPSFANLVFLFASILVIAIFLIEKTPINHRYPFIPYIFIGLVLTQLIF